MSADRVRTGSFLGFWLLVGVAGCALESDGEMAGSPRVVGGTPGDRTPAVGDGGPAADGPGAADGPAIIVDAGMPLLDGGSPLIVDAPGAPDSPSLPDAPVPATAFLIDSMTLRDPHVYASFIGCLDGTSIVNDTLKKNLTNDGDGDGLLDVSPVVVFNPLSQSGGASTPMELVFARCSASSVTCSGANANHFAATGTSQLTGTCLAPLPGTTTASYSPAIDATSGACFSSDAQTLAISLQGITVNLRDARIAAVYDREPATQLQRGLIVGFVSRADANGTMVPLPSPINRTVPLATLLPGGGSCKDGHHSDLDIAPDGERGWYFYLNFTARRAPYTP